HTDHGVLLDLDETADASVVADAAAVEIGEAEDPHLAPEPDVGSDPIEVLHAQSLTRWLPRDSDCWAASRTRTMRSPCSPPLIGAWRRAMQPAKCSTSRKRGSVASRRGDTTSPERYEMSTSRIPAGSAETSTPRSYTFKRSEASRSLYK